MLDRMSAETIKQRSQRFRLPGLVGLIVGLSVLTMGSVAAAATPISGFVNGQIVSVKSGSFVLKDTFGSVADSTVTVTKSSTIIEQVSAYRSDLRTGICLVAGGEKSSNGTVDADRVTISAAVEGKCSVGFGGGSDAGTRPSRAASRQWRECFVAGSAPERG